MALLRLRDLIILFDSASEDDSRITFSHISSARKAQTAHIAEEEKEERWMMWVQEFDITRMIILIYNASFELQYDPH